MSNARAEAAWVRGELGVFEGCPSLVEALRAGDARARAWALALTAQRWLARPEGPPPAAREMAPYLAAAPEAVALAAGRIAVAALCGLDGAALSELRSELTALADAHPAAGFADCVAAFVAGDVDDALARLGAVEQDAARAGLSSVVVDAAAVRALALATRGDVEDALQTARRASRMARTEALPQSEYLAHLVLASVRRRVGQPHAATRILSSLSAIASSPWQAWLSIELLLAGGLEAAAPALARIDPARTDGAARCAHALAGLWRGAAAGDRAAVLACAAEAEATSLLPGSRGEVRDLVICLDVESPLDAASPGARAWILGLDDATPAAAHGACAPTVDASIEEESGAWIVSLPGRQPRRVARVGLALSSAPELAKSRRRSGREDTALATLLLAGSEGMPVDEFFRRVYRFAYAAELHENVLRVLAHRLDARLGDRGQTWLRAGRFALTLPPPVALPDPRCAATAREKVLLFVARQGRAAARDIAQGLGVSLRTVQGALQELGADGMCRREQRGRNVQYVLEDTTFSEPTRR